MSSLRALITRSGATPAEQALIHRVNDALSTELHLPTFVKIDEGVDMDTIKAVQALLERECHIVSQCYRPGVLCLCGLPFPHLDLTPAMLDARLRANQAGAAQRLADRVVETLLSASNYPITIDLTNDHPDAIHVVRRQLQINGFTVGDRMDRFTVFGSAH